MRQPFPTGRPEITVKPSRAKLFSVDFRELPWWGQIPKVGERSLWATYDPPDWKVSSVTEMHAVRPARVHDADGVEIDVNVWEPETGWVPGSWTMYGRLTTEAVQWLATSRIVEGKTVLYTYLDEGFGRDWGEIPRKLEDRARFVPQNDGSLKERKSPRYRSPRAIGAGMYRVKIGRRAFTCLRILDFDAAAGGVKEKGTLMEAYVTRAGRTVLERRYNGRLWGRGKPPWDERFPDHNRIVTDGVTFVHWYDCLSGLACGITNATVSL